MTALSLDLPELLEAIAERAAELVLERIDGLAPSPWMGVDQAAEYVGIPRNSLYKLTAAKAIPHARPGNRLLFRREDLDGWLDDHREGPVGRRQLRALVGGEAE